MTKTLISFVIFLIFVGTSCTTEKVKDCSDYDLDFLYSIGYTADSSKVFVEFSNASNNFPSDGYIEWSINGDDPLYRTPNRAGFTGNGYYSITMEFYAEGFICSVSKEFEITGIK